MSIVIQELNPRIIGKRLGQTLYSPQGNLLLRKGVEITPRFFEHFREKGYQSIFLLDDNGDTRNFNFEADKMLMAAPYTLKSIFRGLKSEETAIHSRAKGELVALAELILVHIHNTLRRPLHLVELKRQQDYLYQHSVCVAVYAIHLGRKLNFHDKKLLSLATSALLHDFGMEFVDSEIVNKQTQLEEHEYEHVKEHTVKGFTHLVRNCMFDGISTVASVQHHERFDGGGYPKQLSGEAIHEYSRIITVADTFDAWTSDRPHRRMNSVDNAMAFLRENQEKMFDAEIVKRFIEVFG